MRVVSTGDKRTVDRLMAIVNTAAVCHGVPQPTATAIAKDVALRLLREGYVLTRQVTRG